MASFMLGDVQGFANNLVGGWTVNSIVTLQRGFPFSPQLSYNPSGKRRHAKSSAPVQKPSVHGTDHPRQARQMV